MLKSDTGHANAIGFWGLIEVMHWKNSSLQLWNKIVESSIVNSYHEILIHIGHYMTYDRTAYLPESISKSRLTYASKLC